MSLAPTFGTEIAQFSEFCGQHSLEFACKFLNIRSIAATDAHKNCNKDMFKYFAHAAHNVNHALSSAMLFCRKFLHSNIMSFGRNRDILNEFRRSFGTPQAPSAVRRSRDSAGDHGTASEAFIMSLRAFFLRLAHTFSAKIA